MVDWLSFVRNKSNVPLEGVRADLSVTPEGSTVIHLYSLQPIVPYNRGKEETHDGDCAKTANLCESLVVERRGILLFWFWPGMRKMGRYTVQRSPIRRLSLNLYRFVT